MTQTKMETSAQRYRRIKEAKLKSTELFDFTSPSGMEWKLRKVDLAQFVANGSLPMSLAQHINQANEANKGDVEAAFASLEWKDQARMIELVSKVVRYCAVEPRIVETVTDPDMEISFDEVELEDYNAIAKWAMPGGDVADGLDTFRKQ